MICDQATTCSHVQRADSHKPDWLIRHTWETQAAKPKHRKHQKEKVKFQGVALTFLSTLPLNPTAISCKNKSVLHLFPGCFDHKISSIWYQLFGFWCFPYSTWFWDPWRSPKLNLKKKSIRSSHELMALGCFFWLSFGIQLHPPPKKKRSAECLARIWPATSESHLSVQSGSGQGDLKKMMYESWDVWDYSLLYYTWFYHELCHQLSAIYIYIYIDSAAGIMQL